MSRYKTIEVSDIVALSYKATSMFIYGYSKESSRLLVQHRSYEDGGRSLAIVEISLSLAHNLTLDISQGYSTTKDPKEIAKILMTWELLK